MVITCLFEMTAASEVACHFRNDVPFQDIPSIAYVFTVNPPLRQSLLKIQCACARHPSRQMQKANRSITISQSLAAVDPSVNEGLLNQIELSLASGAARRSRRRSRWSRFARRSSPSRAPTPRTSATSSSTSSRDSRSAPSSSSPSRTPRLLVSFEHNCEC